MSTHRVESRAPLIDASTAGHHSPTRPGSGGGVRRSASGYGLLVATSVSNMNCALLRRTRRRRRRRPPRHAGAIAGLVLGVRRESARARALC